MTQLSMRLSPDDLIAAGRIHYLAALLRLARATSWPTRLARWGLALVFVLALLPAILGDGPQRFTALRYFGMLLGVLVVVCVLTYFVTVPVNAKRNFAQQTSLRDEISLEWDDLGTRWRAQSWSLAMPFRDYLAYAERDGMVLLYQTAMLYQIVPARSFPSEGARRDMIERLSAARTPHASIANWNARSRGA